MDVCLEDSFGEYSNYIRFVNRFMLEICEYIDSTNEIEKIDKYQESEKYSGR